MKKSHIWAVYFDIPDDKLGWCRGYTGLTKDIARKYVKEGRIIYPRSKWRIVKEYVYV
jgi:hypothetical protein